MSQVTKEQKKLVLIIDEAQSLKAPLLELLRQLMNYESSDQKFLQVVLFAQEEFRARLQHPRFRNLVNRDRKSTRLNSSHANISYAVFCLKNKKSTTSGGGNAHLFST